MVKVKRAYVFSAAVCSIVAVGLSITSIATEHWVYGDIIFVNPTISSGKSSARYGLWSGVFTQTLLGDKIAFEITMTCLYTENACAVLCRATQKQRESELKDLVDGKTVSSFECPFVVKKRYKLKLIPFDSQYKGNFKPVFLNAGCYLCTVIFLSISIACGIVTTLLLMWNVVGNPVQTICSIYSLYYYLLIAAGTLLVAIIVWGALFAASIVENLGILLTLNNQMKYFRDPTLDYSYWINVVAMFLYMCSFAILITRKYLIDHENLIMRNLNQGSEVIF